MKPRTKLPIESFGPEIMTALIAGATRVVELPMAYGTAVRFRRRVHQLRARMREEGHPQRTLVERTRVSIVWGKEAGLAEPELRRTDHSQKVPVDKQTPCKVVLKPYDEEFNAALKAANINVDVNVGSDLKLPSDPNDPLAAFDPTRSE